MNLEENLRNEINNYEQTIHAIVGFANLYRYDDATKKNRSDVTIFQGRRLKPSTNKSKNSNGEEIPFVTPDLGILLPNKNGVLAEVKKSFPKKQDFWMEDFNQLLSYDDDLSAWPTDTGKVTSHDIVLIVHQTREAAVIKFYNQKKNSDIKFSRPFVIIQFNRSDERNSFYFFQKRLGTLSEKQLDSRLDEGISIPMSVFVETYSTIKLYDSEPPLPYLIELIWTNVVLPKAAINPKYSRLRKDGKIEIDLTIDFIIDELCKGFSFDRLCANGSTHQPKIPQREWVERACEKLVSIEEATWTKSKTAIKICFRKYDDVLAHFIESCLDEVQDEAQTKLFQDKTTKI